MRNNKNDEFIRGLGFAVAFLYKIHDQPSMAWDIIKESGFTLEDFEKAKIDPYDMAAIKRLFKKEGKQ